MVRLANPFNALRAKRSAIFRGLRRTLLTLTIVAALLVVAGVVYTWYVGKNQPYQAQQADAESQRVIKRAVATPIEPSEDAPVGVYVQQSVIKATSGQVVTIDARTRVRADCRVEIKYSETKKETLGLEPKAADEYGSVSWKWTLSESTPVGTWPVSVTCTYGEKSGVMTLKLTVT